MTAASHKSTSHLGLASLALSTVGLLLFFMPVLGIPLASMGMLFALAGLAAALACRAGHPAGQFIAVLGRDLRWAILGLLLSSLALGADIVVAFAPVDTVPHQVQPASPSAAPLYVSPPAEP